MMVTSSLPRLALLFTILAVITAVPACTPSPSIPVNTQEPAPSQEQAKEKNTAQKAKGAKQGQAPQKTKISGQNAQGNKQGQSSQNPQYVQVAPITVTGVNLLLGRPTDNSITLNVLSDKDREAFIEYGATQDSYDTKTAAINLISMTPAEILIDALQPNTQYYYRICYKTTGELQFTTGEEHSFNTQRTAGSDFVFTVEADYHRDQNSDPEEIEATFQNILHERPDFNMDLGDTFMGDKFATGYQDVVNRYAADRSYFGIFGSSVPLYLVNGNHEGESGWLLNGREVNLAVWATLARKLYYPNPYPDSFYSGSAKEEPLVGQRQSYYSWEWGDALFVVLDPYWYTATNPKHGAEADNWKWTLGFDQYTWLKNALETSNAKYKFVFTHHILGDMRGGVEWADLYEWGGENRSGAWEFDKMRPGWEEPVHQLMVKNGVTIVFQGHDHLYVKQEKDGIIYQEVPQPSGAPGMSGAINEGSYRSGVIYSSPGHLRVTVSAGGVMVDYVHTALPGDTSDKYKNGEVVYSYSMQ
jgi:hypothetical protein